MKVKEYFKLLTIMHIALIAGQLILGIIVVFLMLNGNIEPSLAEYRNLFLVIAALVTIGSVFSSNIIYKKQVELIKNMTDLRQKITQFKTIYILRLILLEAPSTAAIIFYFLTGSLEFLIFTVAIILISSNLKPNKERIIAELELSDDEKKELEDEDTIISKPI